MIDIQNWMRAYQKEICSHFGARVIFIGLQGSYARKEASDNSDIDVVLILDKVAMDDLIIYRKLVEQLPHRELLCGFVSGKDKLAYWSKQDLFQFYFDTIALEGSLDSFLSTPTAEDAKQAALVGACNLYHACSHNFLHAQDVDTLKMLYKSAFFVMQANHYYKTATYLPSRTKLLESTAPQERTILQVSLDPSLICPDSLPDHSRLLLEWASALICQYGTKQHLS